MPSAASTTDLTLVPMADDWTPPTSWKRENRLADRMPGYEANILYVVDISRRELSVIPVPDSTGTDTGEWVSYDHQSRGVVPTRFHLGSLNLRFHPEFATPEHANVILTEAAPLALTIVDHLLPVIGTSTYDWSAAADMAKSEAEHLIERYPYRGTEHDFPHSHHAYRIEANTFFKALPDLIQPEWAEDGDDRLESTLQAIHQVFHGVSGVEDNFKLLLKLTTTGQLPADVNGRTVTQFHLVGVRAWLYELRKERAGDLTPVDASRWDGITAYALRVDGDSTPEHLDRIAEQVTMAAAEQGVKLLGARSWAWAVCKQRRANVRAELEELGKQIAMWEKDLAPAKKKRRALVTRVLSWGEYGDTNSSLGTLASMSHTAVGAIRDALEREDETSE
ncbi:MULTISPECIES: hypothetical protein [Kitasatospora]|uniref:hypothetical protein n=1 Tax=Kitasatospora TaxID=2063 RepID=UPI000C27A791|nr:hypothetical protein [Kitasatospora sp. CB02891]PJN21126.1 hypothetical protein CG736_34855 [Kitasatospora sp. CB02891]